MPVTNIGDVAAQVQEKWSAMFMDELRESHKLAALVNREYEGDIRMRGSKVKVSQINAPSSNLRTVGVDADSFDTNQLSTTQVEVDADKRAVSAYEFEDLVMLQSQIGDQDSEIRQSLMHDVGQQINNYLYSLVSPSTATPDHVLDSVTDFNASQAATVRTLAAQAKWDKTKGWWGLLDPVFYSDMLDDTTLASSDYGAADAPIIGGELARQRFGINWMEDNSDGILQLSPASAGADCGLIFHPDFLYLVMQTTPQFKISDQHANKRFGFVISVDLVFGAKLGISGDLKHIQVYNT